MANTNQTSPAAVQLETIVAHHDFTVYNKENGEGWMVVRYVTAGTTDRFTASGIALPEAKSCDVRLTGRWDTNPKYGKQFLVDYFTIELPTAKEGIVAYLSSLHVGIGRTIAGRLYDAFGSDLWDVIENNPDKLLMVKGMLARRVKKLTAKMKEQAFMKRFIETFQGVLQITPAQINKLQREFSTKEAMDNLIENPYLLSNIRGFGFRFADKMAMAENLAPDSMNRLRASIPYLLDEAAASGNVCIPKGQFVTRMKDMLNNGMPTKCVTTESCHNALNEAYKAGQIKCTSGMLYGAERHDEEVSIVNSFIRLTKAHIAPVKNLEELITRYEAENDFFMADSQKDAVLSVFSNPVNIITGGPGTGKTSIIKAVLTLQSWVYGDSCEPVLLAPTGRAARRMAEATGYPADTIHSAIHFTGDDAPTDDTELSGNLFIVDETSMVDQFIMSRLLEKIPSGAKVVFVGDPDQLPSVGCGNVLHDMIRSGKLPTTRLSVIFRQSEDNPIVANAKAINEGCQNLKWTRTFKFMPCNTTDDVFNSAMSMYLRCVKAYGLDNVILLNPYRNKSDLNVNRFNLELQKILNPLKNDELSVTSRKITFHKGDKIMQIKNTENAKNGDTGYIRDVTRRGNPEDPDEWLYTVHVEFNDNGEILEYSTTDMENVDLAYCTTVHKSQGSEYETVLIVCSQIHKATLRRNLLYTAVTRAKKNVAIIGDEWAVRQSIINNRADKRYTLLADRMYASL